MSNKVRFRLQTQKNKWINQIYDKVIAWRVQDRMDKMSMNQAGNQAKVFIWGCFKNFCVSNTHVYVEGGFAGLTRFCLW